MLVLLECRMTDFLDSGQRFYEGLTIGIDHLHLREREREREVGIAAGTTPSKTAEKTDRELGIAAETTPSKTADR